MNPDTLLIEITASDRTNATLLKEWLDATPTPFHCIEEASRCLKEAGFTEYKELTSDQYPFSGSGGFLRKDDSALIAFSSASDALEDAGQPGAPAPRLIITHADAPALVLKPQAVRTQSGYLQLSVEVYGGAILSSWFDRPLFLSGPVYYTAADGSARSSLVELRDLQIVLPNVAIHLNPQQNEGQALLSPTILAPLLGTAGAGTSEDGTQESDQILRTKLADALQIPASDIISYTLYLNPAQPAASAGLSQEWILSGRLDNQALCEAAVRSFCKASAEGQRGFNFLLISNHEEVGSLSASGARSLWFRDIITSIYELSGYSSVDTRAALHRGFIISADQAHALHPNFPDLSDPGHAPRLNGGPVIKTAAAQSYTTSARTEAVFKWLCQQVDVPVQTFTNRLDKRGGSTVGPALTTLLPCPAIDVGNALWAMHACSEVGGIKDQTWIKQVFEAFYTVDDLPEY